jgi:ATP-binding cassette subfamily D (ALD) long-chain fatty acid import protein
MSTTFTHERAAALLAVSALLLRSRVVGAPRDALTKRPRTTASAEEVEQALRTGYLEQPDGSRVLLIPQGGRVAKVRAAYTVHGMQAHGQAQVHIHPSTAAEHGRDAPRFPPAPAAHKPALDREFVRQLAALVRVAIPGWTSREALLVALHSLFLVLRTVLSVGVAQLDGRIVRDLVGMPNACVPTLLTACLQVSANGRGFLKGLGLWFALAVPSIYTNAMARPVQALTFAGRPDTSPQIRHLQSTLALRLRTRLTRYIHDLYIAGAPHLRYYRVALPGIDQYLTSDVAAFTDALSLL